MQSRNGTGTTGNSSGAAAVGVGRRTAAAIRKQFERGNLYFGMFQIFRATCKPLRVQPTARCRPSQSTRTDGAHARGRSWRTRRRHRIQHSNSSVLHRQCQPCGAAATAAVFESFELAAGRRRLVAPACRKRSDTCHDRFRQASLAMIGRAGQLVLPESPIKVNQNVFPFSFLKNSLLITTIDGVISPFGDRT
jgi:hypothetical protein